MPGGKLHVCELLKICWASMHVHLASDTLHYRHLGLINVWMYEHKGVVKAARCRKHCTTQRTYRTHE